MSKLTLESEYCLEVSALTIRKHPKVCTLNVEVCVNIIRAYQAARCPHLALLFNASLQLEAEHSSGISYIIKTTQIEKNLGMRNKPLRSAGPNIPIRGKLPGPENAVYWFNNHVNMLNSIPPRSLALLEGIAGSAVTLLEGPRKRDSLH